MTTTQQYISNLNQRYQLGNATEHTFRGDLQQLLESLVPNIQATNEPKRQLCGAPDYILTQKDIPLGYIEAKDIGDKDLDGEKKTGNKEQFDRYRASLNNIIFTDYLRFHFYRNGQCVAKIAIAELSDKGIKALPENFATFEKLIKDFCTHVDQTIKNPQQLAAMMAGKARLLADVIEKALNSDENQHEDSTLKDQMTAFKQILIHDITPKGFADVYAQTITYGMFAARYHDPTLPTFSRQEAAELIPKSNPFLRKLFGYIAGPDLDDRIKWIVDNLVEIFLACNVQEMLKDYGKSTQMEDPIIHFYEDFLSEYDPKLRKARGVWYTPQPVVSFIVRAVDDLLKTEFNLPQGLADNSKTKITVAVQGKKVEQEVHKVQILDPATGTGTFLAETIKHIHKKFKGQQGIWSNYVETHLLPRLNGFELLMASYAMAHLKLDLLLSETGYKSTKNQRFRVFLTNSLEESHPDTSSLFANWLSQEANEANYIKRDTPVMCVIGNPPYSGISSNNSAWISQLIEEYKYVDGVHFGERKHWLNDDYVKFLRYGQHFIEKNGSGILAFINPHGYLDNPTFRGMRWHLLKTYDTIYTIDLHGNAKKKETAPDGSADVNVFDIMQGVSINIFVKTGKKKANELGKVFHFDLYGKREWKYRFLTENSIKTVNFTELKPEKPNFFFVPKSNEGQQEYKNGFGINELFVLNNTGIVTGIDRLSIFMTKEELNSIISRILTIENPYDEYKIRDSRRTSKEGRIEELRSAYNKGIIPISYRPFDTQFTLPFEKNEHWINSPRTEVMQHFLKGENVGLVIPKINKEDNCFFISKYIMAHKLCSAYDSNSIFPLYLYPETSGQGSLGAAVGRVPNLNRVIVEQLAAGLGLRFVAEQEAGGGVFSPMDILDYIYAVLHSPSYREKYKEFLKIDFPRVPYPKDAASFWALVKLGGALRALHLLESPTVEDYITEYPEDGDNTVGKIKYQDGKVYINDTQYFGNVPQVAWEFYIGGYQPAQKWLKDRKERSLAFDDILHYQKIIVALTETARLMQEIDQIELV
ncbi:MAG: N-6 DNA methylase [Chitinophagales bacterium]|nr:N-6 DNA methylase [Chitinophagales bacterium]